ncbi:hypothetical protein [Empedobacter falsenii]
MKPIYITKFNLASILLAILIIIALLGAGVYFLLELKGENLFIKLFISLPISIMILFYFLIFEKIYKINIYHNYFELISRFGFKKQKIYNHEISGYFIHYTKDRFGKVQSNFFLLLKSNLRIGILFDYYLDREQLLYYLTQNLQLLEDPFIEK